MSYILEMSRIHIGDCELGNRNRTRENRMQTVCKAPSFQPLHSIVARHWQSALNSGNTARNINLDLQKKCPLPL